VTYHELRVQQFVHLTKSRLNTKTAFHTFAPSSTNRARYSVASVYGKYRADTRRPRGHQRCGVDRTGLSALLDGNWIRSEKDILRLKLSQESAIGIDAAPPVDRGYQMLSRMVDSEPWMRRPYTWTTGTTGTSCLRLPIYPFKVLPFPWCVRSTDMASKFISTIIPTTATLSPAHT